MSLAPSERRALARIEHLLRSSDPALARMLATFSHPVHSTITWVKRFLPVTLALAVIGGVIMGEVLVGHSSPPPCSAGRAHTTAVWRFESCTRQTVAHRLT